MKSFGLFTNNKSTQIDYLHIKTVTKINESITSWSCIKMMMKKLRKWFNWNINPKIFSLTLERKNKSKLIGSSDYTNLMMNSTDPQSVDTIGEISYASVLYQNYIDSLVLNLINKKENRVLQELYPQDFKKSSQILEKLL